MILSCIDMEELDLKHINLTGVDLELISYVINKTGKVMQVIKNKNNNGYN